MKNYCENIARLGWWIVILHLIFHFTQASAGKLLMVIQ